MYRPSWSDLFCVVL